MGNLFNVDSKLFRMLNTAVDGFFLGILWLVCCLPIITVGSASAAFYYAFNKSIIQEKGYPVKEFFHGFKANFKQATILWLIQLALFVILAFNIYILTANILPIGLFAPFLLVVSALILALTFLWSLSTFPYLSRFQNTLKAGIKTSLILTVANILWSVLLAALFAGALFLFFRVPILSLFSPALYMFCANVILERIFRKYISPEDWEAQFE